MPRYVTICLLFYLDCNTEYKELYGKSVCLDF